MNQNTLIMTSYCCIKPCCEVLLQVFSCSCMQLRQKMDQGTLKGNAEPHIPQQSKLSNRKRKWKPVFTEIPGCSSQQQNSTSILDLSAESKFLKLGTKEYSLCHTKPSDVVTHFTSIMSLPNELLGYIILHLRAQDIGRLAATCLRFNDIISQSHIWRSLCKSHFPMWRGMVGYSLELSSQPMSGETWKRQYSINHTKNITYQLLGSGSSKRRTENPLLNTSSAYGFKKLCCSRDHIFALDLANCLHVYRWERQTITNEYVYKRVDWHQEFAKHVIDVTSDPRYDNNHRRYVYVLTQSETMRSRRFQPNTRSSGASNTGWDEEGNPIAGDKIDVFDERTCRRVFNMTFDPEMRFVSMKLTTITSHQKILFILTDAGKVYSLHLFESSLLNLGSEGMQVTLKSASKTLGEKVNKVETSVGVVSFITESGKLYVILQRKSEIADIFGRDSSVKLSVPQVLPHVAKVVHCSIGDRHLGFIDEYNRAFMVGNNRYGQLGTGDRMDRTTPVQVLFNRRIRILYCSLNHSLVVVESDDSCVMMGTGCGSNGRLPGCTRGSVKFIKLDVKVPWSIRQVDAHKECLFLLSCYDINNETEYKERVNSDQLAESLTLKSQQELLINMKQTASWVDRMTLLEAMVSKCSCRQPLNFSIKPHNHSSKVKSSGNSEEENGAKQSAWPSEEMRIFREAVEYLRRVADSVELDKHILSEKMEIEN